MHGLRGTAGTPVGHRGYGVARGLTDDETPTLFEAWQCEHPRLVVRRVLVVLADMATELHRVQKTTLVDVRAQRVLPPAGSDNDESSVGHDLACVGDRVDSVLELLVRNEATDTHHRRRGCLRSLAWWRRIGAVVDHLDVRDAQTRELVA